MSLPVTQSMAATANPIPSMAALQRAMLRCPRPRGKPTDTLVHNLPEFIHPRDKLLSQGAQSLSAAELLSLILGCGTAMDAAQSLLSEFGSLRDLLSADQQRWETKRGVGPARYAALMAAVELGRRYYKEALLSVSALTHPEAVKTFLRAQLQDRHYEVFGCLYLDERFQMLNFEELFRGTIDSANVYPREVVRQVLMYNATAIIVAHNHPSGCCEPSKKDEGITQRLQQALSLVNVRLVDHYIVGDGECYSFAEHGLL